MDISGCARSTPSTSQAARNHKTNLWKYVLQTDATEAAISAAFCAKRSQRALLLLDNADDIVKASGAEVKGRPTCVAGHSITWLVASRCHESSLFPKKFNLMRICSHVVCKYNHAVVADDVTLKHILHQMCCKT